MEGLEYRFAVFLGDQIHPLRSIADATLRLPVEGSGRSGRVLQYALEDTTVHGFYWSAANRSSATAIPAPARIIGSPVPFLHQIGNGGLPGQLGYDLERVLQLLSPSVASPKR